MSWASRKPARHRVPGELRGWAHVGVLQTLDETGIKIDVVADLSAGSVNGAYFAAGAFKEFGAKSKSLFLLYYWFYHIL